MRNSTIAIILGGGQGTRLYPLTKGKAKPAVPIGGKYRLVDIPISNCLNSRLFRIYVLTQFNSASLNSHIKNTFKFETFLDGFIDILAAEQTPENKGWFQGTADAVRQSMHHMKDHQHATVLVLSGDQLYQMDYRDLFDKHRQNGADLTIATIPVVAKDATGFGIIKTYPEGKIEDFVEKPSASELQKWKSETPEKFSKDRRVYLASMGIYLFSKKALRELFEGMPEATDFGKEIIPRAINSDLSVESFEFDGYWTDIGTIESYFKASLDLTNNVPRFNLFDNEDNIYTQPRYLPSSKLSGTTFEHSVLAEGCIIEASRIEQSVIGIRSRIGKGTSIERSIIMGNGRFESQQELSEGTPQKPSLGIGHRCFISNAIIDANCRIGSDVRITGGPHLEDGDHGDYYVVDDIVVIPEGTVIEDGAHI
jgi:glucose-1-phosphate adenylyltransferase